MVELSERHTQILGWKGAPLEAKDVGNIDLDNRRSIKEKNMRLEEIDRGT
jgi:hypothetical protein